MNIGGDTPQCEHSEPTPHTVASVIGAAIVEREALSLHGCEAPEPAGDTTPSSVGQIESAPILDHVAPPAKRRRRTRPPLCVPPHLMRSMTHVHREHLLDLNALYCEAKGIANLQGEDKAHEFFEEAIEKRPCDSSLLMLYALFLQVELANLVRSEQVYREVIRLDPFNSMARCNYASILASTFREPEAEEMLKIGIAIDGNIAALYNNYAYLLQKMKRDDEAELYYRRSLAVEPNLVCSRQIFAAFLNRRGKVEEALEMYAHAVRLGPSRAQLYMDYCDLLLSLGRFEEALGVCEGALRACSDNGTLLVYFAGFLRQAPNAGRQELERAEALLKKAVDIDPECPDTIVKYGDLLQDYHDRYFDAERLYELAFKLQPSIPAGHRGYACLMWRMGRPETARRHYAIAVHQSPSDPVALVEYAQLLKDSGMLECAGELFWRAINASVRYETLVPYGSYLTHLFLHSHAEAVLKRALQMRPCGEEAMRGIGVLFRQAGLFGKSYAILLSSLNANPNIRIVMEFVYLCMQMGWKESAAGAISLISGRSILPAISPVERPGNMICREELNRALWLGQKLALQFPQFSSTLFEHYKKLKGCVYRCRRPGDELFLPTECRQISAQDQLKWAMNHISEKAPPRWPWEYYDTLILCGQEAAFSRNFSRAREWLYHGRNTEETFPDSFYWLAITDWLDGQNPADHLRRTLALATTSEWALLVAANLLFMPSACQSLGLGKSEVLQTFVDAFDGQASGGNYSIYKNHLRHVTQENIDYAQINCETDEQRARVTEFFTSNVVSSRSSPDGEPSPEQPHEESSEAEKFFAGFTDFGIELFDAKGGDHFRCSNSVHSLGSLLDIVCP